MVAGRISALREVFRPKFVRFGSIALACLFAYDAASNQLALPKISQLWGVSGSLIPWWGWLLILQTIFVYALFEYVRRNVGLSHANAQQYDDTELRRRIDEAEERSLAAERALAAHLQTLSSDNNLARVAARRDFLGKLIDRVNRSEAELDEAFEAFESAAKIPLVPMSKNRSFEHSRTKLSMARGGVEMALSQYSPKPVRLGLHPNYTLNPMKKVGQDSEVPDEERRQDYRLAWDQVQTDKKTIRKMLDAMNAELRSLDAAWAKGGDDGIKRY